MRSRRALGAAAFFAGLALVGWSFCPLVLTAMDTLNLANTWDMTCPTRIESHALLVSGLVVILVGHRLFTGRNLRTGERPD